MWRLLTKVWSKKYQEKMTTSIQESMARKNESYTPEEAWDMFNSRAGRHLECHPASLPPFPALCTSERVGRHGNTFWSTSWDYWVRGDAWPNPSSPFPSCLCPLNPRQPRMNFDICIPNSHTPGNSIWKLLASQSWVQCCLGDTSWHYECKGHSFLTKLSSVWGLVRGIIIQWRQLLHEI